MGGLKFAKKIFLCYNINIETKGELLMKVENVKVYDLEESIIASGYPMRTSTNIKEMTEKDLSRAIKLSEASVKDNGAHGQFLTGIRVSFDLTFTNKAWVEAERYRFLEFVSSQSTMHRITKFDLDNVYNEYVDDRIIEIMKEKVSEYNNITNKIKNMPHHDHMEEDLMILRNKLKEKYLEILYSNPAGFELTARMTTNYRCLKNIYKQRKRHRLPEWREFCGWIETLPYAKELILEEDHTERLYNEHN